MADFYVQRLCEAGEAFYARDFEGAFDLADVDGVEVRFFGQLFHRQAGALAIFANTRAQQFPLFETQHRAEGKQASGWQNRCY